jgi:arylsulfatase A-like enzyme
MLSPTGTLPRVNAAWAQKSSCFNQSVALPDRWIKEKRRAYRAAVSWVDYLVGMVVGKIRDLKLQERTIVVLMGDHG